MALKKKLFPRKGKEKTELVIKAKHISEKLHYQIKPTTKEQKSQERTLKLR
jgi:hypothetical protein